MQVVTVKRRIRMRVAWAAVLIGLAVPNSVSALDKVTFGTNWLADPEAGGFYQALVDGTYAKYGLDVTIKPGGPQSNGGYLLIVGKIQFWVFWKSSGRFWGVKAVKGPVDIGFWRLGPARKFGIMGDGEIGQGTASAVGWIFVLGLSGARDRSWRIW
jgi:hypothetical protein